MLTAIEQEFIKKFFEDFPTADLSTVALNISKYNLSPSTREDALNIICQHSNCIETILERKKITKGYLSKYLHKNHVSITDSWDKPALIRKILDFYNSKLPPVSAENDSVPAPSVTLDISSSNSINTSSITSAGDDFYCQLSYQFSKWFYSLINDDDFTKLGPEHFFPDSSLKLGLQSVNSSDIQEANNASDIVRILHDMKRTYNFKFLPNLNPSAIRYNSDIHGQVAIIVGGTLHSNSSQIVGLFEQAFLLIRDPSDNNNWKIKNNQLILRKSNVAIESSDSNDHVLRIGP